MSKKPPDKVSSTNTSETIKMQSLYHHSFLVSRYRKSIAPNLLYFI